MKNYDLLVIGGGSGGVRASRRAAELGKNVLLCEKSELGGTCVNVGCVPKKLFYYASDFPKYEKMAKAYGFTQAQMGEHHWTQFIQRKNDEILRLNKAYEKNLQNAGVEVIFGEAQLTGAQTVSINNQNYHADKILLATGGVPARMDIPGAELAWVSDDLFYLKALPKSVIMVGAGYIALEFAGIFAGFGVETTLCYRADMPMRAMDDDMRQRLCSGLVAHGIELKPNVSPRCIEKTATGKKLTFDNGESIEAEAIVFATGRHPNINSLNLECAAIETRDNKTIIVDENFRSSCDSIFALGDLLQTLALTPVAIMEAERFIKRVFRQETDTPINYDIIPTAIFSHPQMATVGLSEKNARKVGQKIHVYANAFKPMKTGFSDFDDESYFKLIVDPETDRVLGAQILGDDAAEILQGIAVAICAGATKKDFDSTVGIHPSSAEEFVTLRNRLPVNDV